MTADPMERHRRLREIIGGVWTQLAADTMTALPLLSAELALPTPQGPVRLARDADGLPHLLVPLPGNPPPTTVYRSSGLRMTVRALVVGERPALFADLACLRGDVREVFLSLVADACERVASAPADPAGAVRRSVEEWRTLFTGTGGGWTRARLAGLYAELTVLLRLLERHPGAAHTWTGPQGAAQDFRATGQAAEVKATLGGEGRVVRIHGSDQLDVLAGTVLHLAWFRLADGPGEKDGATVRELLDAVVVAAADLTVLLDRIEQLALPAPGTSELDERRFAVLEERWLRVDAGFPKVVPASFAGGALPAGVGGLEYLVDLDVVPDAFVDEPEPVLDRLGAGS